MVIHFPHLTLGSFLRSRSSDSATSSFGNDVIEPRRGDADGFAKLGQRSSRSKRVVVDRDVANILRVRFS